MLVDIALVPRRSLPPEVRLLWGGIHLKGFHFLRDYSSRWNASCIPSRDSNGRWSLWMGSEKSKTCGSHDASVEVRHQRTPQSLASETVLPTFASAPNSNASNTLTSKRDIVTLLIDRRNCVSKFCLSNVNYYAYSLLGSCHKRRKPQAPTPQAPIRNRQTRKVANAKGLKPNLT